ncbi:hypothetical protein GCM10027612_49450 [Microbispora bryophytorum subsp. camponoti]
MRVLLNLMRRDATSCAEDQPDARPRGQQQTVRRSGQQQARQPERTAQQPGHSMRQPERSEQPARQPGQPVPQSGRQRGPSVQQSLVGEGPARPRIERQAVTRVFDGITCYEVPARAALERVPEAAELPFTWGASPYRGCEAGCGYCTARRGHRYLGLDPGCDFSTKIVVKTDLARRLRRELDSPLERRAGRAGPHRRLLPARRGDLPPDARRHPDARRRGQPVHRAHQEPARPA